MLTIFRWLLRLTVALLVAVVLMVVAAWYFAMRSLPDYGATYRVEGISAPVEIVRSTENVPHIFGQTDTDVFFALGLAHAQDRLFQMMVLRRAAQGRLSEIYGPRTLAEDDLARRLGLYRAAQASVAAQDETTRAALTAYAAGVNQWIVKVNEGALGRGAPEFFLYPDTITYWEPADSLAILNLIAAQATVQIRNEVRRARLSMAAPERGQDLMAMADEPALPAYASLFPGIARATPGVDSTLTPQQRLAGYASPGLGLGANAFAASAARTAAGGAILANDPQLPLTAPSLWYLARLELQSGGVIGATIPGIPSVLSGRSKSMGWGITPAGIDDQDIFIEEVEPGNANRYRTEAGWTEFTTRQEIIRVADAQSRTITLRESRNGPVIPGAHFGLAAVTPPGHVAALSWTGARPGDTTMSGLIALMQAPDRGAAAQVATQIVAPALELTLADSGGVARLLAGAIPARPITHQTLGRMPVPGWVVENRWQGRLPPAANPRDLSPENGVVMATGSAQQVQGLGFDWPDSQRTLRLGRLMELREVHTRESFIAAQIDTVSPAARGLLPLTGAELWFTGEPAAPGTPERQRQDALALLAEWDGDMSEHLPEPLIYAAWMDALQNRLIRDELGPLADEFRSLRPDFIERVFRNINGASVWCDIVQSAPVETCAVIARQSLDAAIVDLTARFGPDVASWRWGDAHEAVQAHPGLGAVPGLGWIVNLRQSTSGGEFTLARAGFMNSGKDRWRDVTGSGYRGVYDLADPDSSVFIISTGQSGHPLSRHYDDLSGLWRRGEYIGMSLDPALARAAAAGVTTLLPAGASDAR